MASHDVSIDLQRGIVTKRFRSWARGEPAREWTALCLLADEVPGLAPQPLSADIDVRPLSADMDVRPLSADMDVRPLSADMDVRPPVITMSWLPGDPLSGAAISPAQMHALARSLDELWRPVPPSARLTASPGQAPNPAAFTRQVRAALAAGHDLGGDPLVRRARAAAAGWLNSSTTSPAAGTTVLGQGDPNLANFLWDGHRVRLVDFEDSGPSDRAFELALLVEHISAWSDTQLDAGPFVALFDLTTAEKARLLHYRRLAALFWLMLLRPASRASRRNPPGTLNRQAGRLLALLA